MKHDLVLSQLISAATLAKVSDNVPDIDPEDTFKPTLKKEIDRPEPHLVEKVGENQYRFHLDTVPETDQMLNEAKVREQIKRPDDGDQGQTDGQDADYKGQGQIVVHQAIHEGILLKPTKPLIQSFIEEAVERISKIQLAQGHNRYEFDFREPPLRITFSAKDNEMTIQIIGNKNALHTEDQWLKGRDALKELIKIKEDLILSLQQLFPEKTLEVEIETEVDYIHNNPNPDQDQSDSSDQSPDKTDDDLAEELFG